MAIAGNEVEFTYWDPAKGDKFMASVDPDKALEEFKRVAKKLKWI